MRRIVPLFLLLGLTGCQSAAADRPARLAPEESHLEALRQTVGQMMHTARIDFGPSDPLRSSTITVLPPPAGQYETRSPSLPVRFDLLIRDGKCLVVRQDTRESRELPPKACVPVRP